VTDIITPLIAIATGKNLEENFIVLHRNPNEPHDTPVSQLISIDFYLSFSVPHWRFEGLSGLLMIY
jgi:hypothetical protein